MANQSYKDKRIIALERAERTEIICEKCNLGIMTYTDSKTLKCSYCKLSRKEDDN